MPDCGRRGLGGQMMACRDGKPSGVRTRRCGSAKLWKVVARYTDKSPSDGGVTAANGKISEQPTGAVVEPAPAKG
jgi:hypothetical protein